MGSSYALSKGAVVLALAAAQLCHSTLPVDRRNGFLSVYADYRGLVLHSSLRMGCVIGVQLYAWHKDSDFDRDCCGMARATSRVHDLGSASRLACLLMLYSEGYAHLMCPWDLRFATGISRLSTVELVVFCLFLRSCSAICHCHSCFAALFL
jgi:hypothetical protein